MSVFTIFMYCLAGFAISSLGMYEWTKWRIRKYRVQARADLTHYTIVLAVIKTTIDALKRDEAAGKFKDKPDMYVLIDSLENQVLVMNEIIHKCKSILAL